MRRMDKLFHLRLWRDNQGQDLIEYALMAGFIAVAAGALMPNIAGAITAVFTAAVSVLTTAGS
ncbi:MAG: Flp family type IVb pilin [Acidobacteriota bacterium]|nr:Flp family type IVb pilin [Acidobacteriota bacterium]